MKNHHYCENSSFWWKCVMVVNIHHCDENLSLVEHCHVLMLQWLKSKPSLKFIIVMKFFHFDENPSNQINHFGELGSPDQSDQLYFSMFSCIWTFWYFPGWLVGGWLGGWGKLRLKTISAQLKLKLGLSLAIVYRWLTSCPLDKEFEDLLD